MGYSGYADFKRSMASEMIKRYRARKDNMAPGEKYLCTTSALTKDDVVVSVMNKALANINNTFAATDHKLMKKIANCILKSTYKYVIGFRGASSCSNYMARKLVLLQPNVICLDRAESLVLEQLVDITKNDCVIMYSFPRYSKLNFVIMDIVKERGAKIILITDRLTSPLAAKADYVLTASVEGVGITVSYMMPMCLSEIILLLISKMLDEEDQKRIKFLDEIVSKQEMY